MNQAPPRAREGQLLLVSGVTLLLLAAVLTVLATIYDTFPGDHTVGEWAPTIGSWFEPIGRVFNERDEALGIAGGLMAVGTLWWRRHFDALAVALVVGAARPLLQLLKPLVDRPRPEAVIDIATTAAFPSGHVLTAMTVASIWFVFAPLLVGERAAIAVRVLSVAVVVLMSVSRMWAGMHWFSDTYGAVIWVAAVMLIALGVRRRVVSRFVRDERAV